MKNKFIILFLLILWPSISNSGGFTFNGGTWSIQPYKGNSIEVKKVEIDELDDGTKILIYTLPDGVERYIEMKKVSNLNDLVKMSETGTFIQNSEISKNKQKQYDTLKAEQEKIQLEIRRREQSLQQELHEMKSSYNHSIRSNCTQKWGSDYKMVEYCIKQQTTAKRKVSSHSGGIRLRCEQKWQDDYKMVEYCINQQSTAKRKISSRDGAIKSRCENKWGNDYKMVEYCIDQQTTAKRNIDSSYRNSSKRPICERKWGADYRMVEYCIEQ